MWFRDQDGRPLGEGKLSPERVADIPMRRGTCPYPGSRQRHAHPMNLSALAQIRAHWDDCRGLLAWLRALYLAATGRTRVTVSDLWRIARIGQSLPAWLVLRRRDPVADGALPPAIAVLYKVVIGINALAQSFHLKAVLGDGFDADAPAARDALIEHLETHGLLIGPREVCAGPQAMIAEALDLLIAGAAGTLDVPAGFDGVGGPTPLRGVIGDAAKLTAYAFQAMRFQAAGYVTDLISQALGRAVSAAIVPEAFGARAREIGAARDTLAAALSDHELLRPAMVLPAAALSTLARSAHAFMAGPQPDGDPTSAALDRLIDGWCWPHEQAEAVLGDLLGADAPPAMIGALATQLALERHWLRLNQLGDDGLERCLGHMPPGHGVAALDTDLGDTPLRRCFAALFEAAFRHDEAGAWVAHGCAQRCVPAALLG